MFDLIAAMTGFGEVAGIMEIKELNAAAVIYTLLRTGVTPFGRMLCNMQENTRKKNQYFGNMMMASEWRSESGLAYS